MSVLYIIFVCLVLPGSTFSDAVSLSSFFSTPSPALQLWVFLTFIVCSMEKGVNLLCRCFCTSSCDQFIDRIPFCRKLFFILCHNISFIHLFMMMQVVCIAEYCPSIFSDLLQRKIKQLCVIRLKLHCPVFCKDLVITGQKIL